MRAWQFLLGAARDHRVTLVAGSPNFPSEDLEPTALLSGLVEAWTVLPWRARDDAGLVRRRLVRALGGAPGIPSDWAIPTRRLRRRLETLRGESFDRAVVCRLYMLPVALEILRGDVSAIDVLDLDDWESASRRSIAALAPETARGRSSDAAANDYEALEERWLPHLRKVAICSEADRTGLERRHPGTPGVVVPNAIDVPERPPEPSSSGPSLLFVGSLGYEPNVAGLRWFLSEVLPELRRRDPAIRLDVVGGGAARDFARELSSTAGVVWHGAVESLDRHYAEARVAIVPIRAGGGTRLKLLEAFAQARPVVSTAFGAFGLGARDGQHYLRAESPAEWIQASLRALEGGPAIERLSADAHDFARGFSRDRAIARVTEILAERSLGSGETTCRRRPHPPCSGT